LMSVCHSSESILFRFSFFFVSREDFPVRDDFGAKRLVAQWWAYGLYLSWF
jgi:hypothetical protein